MSALIKNATLALFVAFAGSLLLGAAEPAPKMSQQNLEEKYKRKTEILRRDQIDNTSTLAIPLDDSEIEDEEEINRLEKREVFSIPKAP